MIKKIYVNAQDYLRDCWRLGRQIRDSKWRPDWLVALWRGGAPVGMAVHEYLKCQGFKMHHIAMKCSSYTGLARSETEVTFELADPVFAAIRPGEKVLVVDDVFDTGRTGAALKAKITARGAEMRLACVYFKPENNVTSLSPDWYVRLMHDWIVFPHEIEGLTREEIAEKDPVLAELF